MLTDMARLPRLDLPGIPQHVVQRGNNRLPCFLDDGDRLRYRAEDRKKRSKYTWPRPFPQSGDGVDPGKNFPNGPTALAALYRDLSSKRRG